MRILVLGGAGFVGGAAVQLLMRSHEVAVFHRGQGCTVPEGPFHIHGDRRQLAGHRAAFAALRPDVVLDVAPQNDADATRTVSATRGIAGRIVGISSGSVYRSFGVLAGTEDGLPEASPSAEDAPLRRRLWPYRNAQPRPVGDPRRFLDHYDKIPAERTLMGCAELACSIVRLPMIYGPGDPDGRVQAYARRMLSGARHVPLQRRAAAWRNARAFLGNAAHGIALVVTHGAPGGIYNLAEPEDFTEGEWVGHIAAALGWNGTIRLRPDGDPDGAPLGELPPDANYAQHLRMDTSRIRRELGYAEQFDFPAGLHATLAVPHP